MATKTFVGLRIEQDLVEYVDARAKEENSTRSEVLRKLIDAGIKVRQDSVVQAAPAVMYTS